MLSRLDRASTTVIASICGVSSDPITVRTSGFSPISAGYYHLLALKSDGTMLSWGYNEQGETDVPPEITDVVQVAAGRDFSLALKSDGTVVAWGTNIDTGNPMDVPAGLTGVVQVDAGLLHSVALKSDGTVVTWGNSDFGQMNIPAGLVVTVP